MLEVYFRDVLQTGTLIFVAGAFVQQSRSTAQRATEANAKIEDHEKRLQESARDRALITATMARAIATQDRIEARLDRHEREFPCADHTATLKTLEKEVERLRNNAEGHE